MTKSSAYHHARLGGEERRSQHGNDGKHHPRQVMTGDVQEPFVVLTMHRVPEPGVQREVCGVYQGEAASFVSGGIADVDGEEHDEQHLGKRIETGTDVLATVQIVEKSGVDPCEPDQTEDQHKLGDGPRSDVVGNGARGGGDHHHIDEVVKQFEKPDRTVLDDVPVSTWGLPKPASEVSQHRGQPSPIESAPETHRKTP